MVESQILSLVSRREWTHHSARLVVMEIHQVPQLPGLLQLLLVGAVDELPGEVDPIAQVVTETR